jgi:hypothetical protein
MSRTTGKKSHKRLARDFYQTPHWCIYPMADLLTDILHSAAFADAFYLCDIGAGDGRIGLVCRERLDGYYKLGSVFIDVTNRHPLPKSCKWLKRDYLTLNIKSLFKVDSQEMPRIFVSNPPFSICDEIVFKTVEYLYECGNGIAIFFLRVNWLGSRKRNEWLQRHPPKKMIVLSPRPSFTKGRTDTTEYAWFMWSPDLIIPNPFKFVQRKQDK